MIPWRSPRLELPQYDFRVSFGIVRGLDSRPDSRDDAVQRNGLIRPHEWLVALRAAF
jgi:hypothetical protein